MTQYSNKYRNKFPYDIDDNKNTSNDSSDEEDVNLINKPPNNQPPNSNPTNNQQKNDLLQNNKLKTFFSIIHHLVELGLLIAASILIHHIIENTTDIKQLEHQIKELTLDVKDSIIDLEKVKSEMNNLINEINFIKNSVIYVNESKIFIEKSKEEVKTIVSNLYTLNQTLWNKLFDIDVQLNNMQNNITNFENYIQKNITNLNKNINDLNNNLQRQINNLTSRIQSIGEYVSSYIPLSSAVSLNGGGGIFIVTSINLTPGIWNVEGVIVFHGTATNLGSVVGCISTIYNGCNNFGFVSPTFPITNVDYVNVVPNMMLSLTSNTIVYLVATASFSGGSISSYGRISATRIG
jgi:hypothetical protein